MKLGQILLICAVLSVAQLHLPAASPQTKLAHPHTAIVPFVGCASDGQVGPIDAPKGHGKALAIPAAVARRLAYYQAQNGFGILAPRGWSCFSTYGSSGSNLFVSPDPIHPKEFFSSTWKGFSGPAIQVSIADGGTSGRFAVARAIARYFPAHKAFLQSVIEEGIEPLSDFPSGHFPNDKLTYVTPDTVEFETSANSKGIGTTSYLLPNASPIRGVALLFSGETSLLQLSARLPKADKDLLAPILQYIEREAVQSDMQQ